MHNQRDDEHADATKILTWIRKTYPVIHSTVSRKYSGSRSSLLDLAFVARLDARNREMPPDEQRRFATCPAEDLSLLLSTENPKSYSFPAYDALFDKVIIEKLKWVTKNKRKKGDLDGDNFKTSFVYFLNNWYHQILASCT